MFLVGTCQKCKNIIKLDIKDKPKERIVNDLSRWQTFECPGHHVELCSPFPNYWKLDEWELQEGAAESEAEFLENLKQNSVEVRDTEGMEGMIKSFSCGYPITKDGHAWNYTTSPLGKRYYFR